MGEGFFKVKNLDKYQHYKFRRPAWIKLYLKILENYEFSCLPDASKWHALGIWLLASKHENRLPWDEAWISKQINSTSKADLKILEQRGFIERYTDASSLLEDIEDHASQNVRTEYRVESTENRDSSKEECVVLSSSKGMPEIPPELAGDDFFAAWAEWQLHRKDIRKPFTPRAARMALKALVQLGKARAIAAIEHSIANGYQGIFESSQRGGSQPSDEVPESKHAEIIERIRRKEQTCTTQN